MAAAKALALLSGGLDSILAARVVKDLGVDVSGVVFDSGFFSLEPPGRAANDAGEPHPLLERLAGPMGAAGIPVELVDVSEEFFRLLRKPAHGFGSHINPCIDCKILFLRRARRMLEEGRADFLVTGEVLGQRPMSQNAQALHIIGRDAECEDLLLRPLSAQLLPPTKPEREGWVPRDKLYAFSGRTRKPQMELAARLGLGGYAQPAGGCVLTDEGFERRLRDFLSRLGEGRPLTFTDVARLRLGRHFRLPGGSKVIVGRNARENGYLERYAGGWAVSKVTDRPGPIVLADAGDEVTVRFALGAAARYANVPSGERAAVEWVMNNRADCRMVSPLAEEELQAARI